MLGLLVQPGWALGKVQVMTNTADGVATTIVSAVGPAFDKAIVIGVGIIAILLVVGVVRRAIKARG